MNIKEKHRMFDLALNEGVQAFELIKKEFSKQDFSYNDDEYDWCQSCDCEETCSNCNPLFFTNKEIELANSYHMISCYYRRTDCDHYGFAFIWETELNCERRPVCEVIWEKGGVKTLEETVAEFKNEVREHILKLTDVFL